MEQTMILVDGENRAVGYAPRGECHSGDGKLHRAIAVLIHDGRGRLLLQRRKSMLWDGFWDLTGATHPLRLGDRDETTEEATHRCLWTEWGIDAPVEEVLSFVYFARQGGHCENEYCTLFLGEFQGQVALNPEHGYEYRWAAFADCLASVALNPEQYTPWATITLERLSAHPVAERLREPGD